MNIITYFRDIFLKSKIKATGLFLFVAYVLFSWVLSEFHPFSQYPMYNSFPNYSYAYYVADDSGKMLPLNDYFDVRANEISHLFVRICEERGFVHGFNTEPDSSLKIVGMEMLKRILVSKTKSLPTDSLSIYRVYWHIENNQMIKDERQLYKAKVE